ncbi:MULTISPECIES: hypothetical protein [Bacteria]|jgi:hypothetical protein|uniref:hypothetical protein n=1 Tax=Bacteria TaxID=2 RepID=UPI0036F8807C
MTSIETLADTLRELAASATKPKDLMAATREKHPNASKKEIVRAAFYRLIESHGADPEHVKGLHAFALNERSADDGEPPKAAKLRKKKIHKKEGETKSSH